MSPAARLTAEYWHRNRRLIAALLVVWFVVTFGVAFFARELSFMIFGWPLSFWVASQGALVVYLLIVGIYTWRMERLDAELDDRAD